jgi:hypothetical protein
MKNSFAWLRIVVALFILLNIIFRYDFGLETFELRWVESGISNWLLAPVFIRIFAFFELLICVLLLFNVTSKKTVSYTLIFLLFTYILDIIVGNSNSITHSYYLFYFFTPTFSLIALSTFCAMALAVILSTKSTPIIALKKRWQALIIVLLWIGVFFMNHLSFDDFKIKKTEYEVGVSNWELFFEELTLQQAQFNSNNYVVAFFSTDCDVCHWNAMKLNAAINYYNKPQQLLIVFFQPQDKIDFFLNSTKINAPYIVLQPNVATNLVGDGFPAFCEIKDGKVVQDFSPKEFNYAEIHRLFSSN